MVFGAGCIDRRMRKACRFDPRERWARGHVEAPRNQVRRHNVIGQSFEVQSCAQTIRCCGPPVRIKLHCGLSQSAPSTDAKTGKSDQTELLQGCVNFANWVAFYRSIFCPEYRRIFFRCRTSNQYNHLAVAPLALRIGSDAEESGFRT